MLFDPRAMSRHLARRLAIEATGACLLLAGAGYAFTRAAYGQALDTPAVPAGHPVDWLSALYGGGGTGAVLAVVVAILVALNKAGVPVGFVIGKGAKAEKPAPESPSSVQQQPEVIRLQEQVRQLERDGHERDKRISLIASGTTRLEASIKEVRDLLHDILVRRLGKGS